MSSFYFITGNLLAAYISAAVAQISMNPREGWRRVIAALAGFPVIVLLTVFFLGTIGKLTAVWVVITLALTAAPLPVLQKRFVKNKRQNSVQADSVSAVKKAGKTPWEWISITLLAWLLGMFITKTCLSGTGYFWDDLNYHATAPAHWLLDERLSLGSFNYHAYFPLNSEVFSLWFMLPFHNDALVNLCGLYWGMLSASAILILGLSLGASLATSCLLSALFLSSPVVTEWAATFSAADLAAPAMLLSAIALCMPSPGNRKTRIADALYIGLFSGFAIGCKVSFAPVLIILAGWILFGRRKPDALSGWEVAVFLAGVMVTGSFWYIRNLALTGNPLFPAEIKPFFEGPFGSWQQNRSRLIHWILAAPTDWEQWKFLLEEYLNWPYTLSLLAGIGYLGTLFGKRPKNLATKEAGASMRSLLLIVGLTLILIYPLTPFSGTVDRPYLHLRVVLRFTIAHFVIGLVLFAPMIEEKSTWQRFYHLLFAVVASVTLFARLPDLLEPSSLISGGILLGVWSGLGWLPEAGILRWTAGCVLLSIILTALAIQEPSFRRLADEKIHKSLDKNWLFCPTVGSAWRFLETLPEGSTIAPFGAASWLYYPLFGRRLQLKPRFLRKHMHEYWKKEGTFWDGWIRGQKSGSARFSWCYANRDVNTFISELSANGTDYAIVVRETAEDWPYPRMMLNSSNRAHLIYEDGCAMIWKLDK